MIPPPMRSSPVADRMFTHQRANQRRFSRAVRTEESNRLAAHQRDGEIADENAILHADRDVLGDDDAISAALAGLEPHRHDALVGRRRAQARKSIEAFAASFRLLAVLPRDVARDVVLLGGDLFLLLRELPLLRESPQRPLFHERCVAAVVRRRRIALEVQHVVDDRGEKRAIVADQQHRGIHRREVFLEPARCLEIQVVRRLVEQQHVGWTHELARQTQTPAFAAAQLRNRIRSRAAGSKPSPCSTASTRGAMVYPPSRSKRSRSLPYLLSAASLESCSRFAACSISDRSSASRSANCPAAASQIVIAPANSRCCSSRETRESRAVARVCPRVGVISPVKSRNSVVFPVPFLPDDSPSLATRDGERDVGKQRRRAKLYDEPPRQRVGSRGRPALPVLLGETNRQRVSMAHQGDAKQERFVGKLLEPALVRETRVLQTQLRVPLRVAVDQAD